jgi:hypothetical protein
MECEAEGKSCLSMGQHISRCFGLELDGRNSKTTLRAGILLVSKPAISPGFQRSTHEGQTESVHPEVEGHIHRDILYRQRATEVGSLLV